MSMTGVVDRSRTNAIAPMAITINNNMALRTFPF
jgi:hypothetical protein